MRGKLFGFILIFLLGLASAQSVRVYYASDLQITPGSIKVAPGYTTLIDLFAPVEEQYIGNTGLVDAKTQSNVIAIFAKERSGRTDMILRVAGKTLLFKVEITTREEGPFRYLIHEARPSNPLTGTAVFQKANTEFRSDFLRVTGQANLNNFGTATVRILMQNLSAYPLELDPASVRVFQGGMERGFRLIRSQQDTTLKLLETQEWALEIQGVSQSPIEVRYRISFQGKTYQARVLFELSRENTTPLKGVSLE